MILSVFSVVLSAIRPIQKLYNLLISTSTMADPYFHFFHG